jgi:broad specificity phosphatase PhoE
MPLFVCGVARFSQAVGLVYDNATWPQANAKCLPCVPTALQMVLPTELARIVAVAHSGVMWCLQADAIRLENKGFQLTSFPNARTTSG